MKREYRPEKDLAILAFLLTICILRFVANNNELFAVLSLISVFIAVYDVYMSIESEYEIYGGRFFIVRGIFVCLCIFSAIIMASLLVTRVQLPDKVYDELTTIALLICLPKELYCYIIGKYIKNEEDK